MQKCLYLLCPTDCLEPIINNTFKHQNYFYTSLGNSFISDCETIEHIKQVVKKYNIKKICFVLSLDNLIIEYVLKHQDFSKIKGLKSVHNEVITQKNRSKTISQTGNDQLSFFSYYLNQKIKGLNLELNNLFNQSIKISGKIYDRKKEIFTNIYSNLICIEKYHLN